MPDDEATRLARLRDRGLEADELDAALARSWSASDEALAMLAEAPRRLWGHDMFQSTRAFAASAIVGARAGWSGAEARIRELGQWIEGGSLAGHTLALPALLGVYDRLEDHPPWSGGALDDDLRQRLSARNALLRPAVRATAQLRLALCTDAPVDAELYTDAAADDALAGEAALRSRDWETAVARFGALQRWREGWDTQLRGESDPRATGHLGLARVRRGQGRVALVLAECDAALAIDAQHPQALLLAAATALELRLIERARTYQHHLQEAHPFTDVTLDELTRDAVETGLGVNDPRRQALRAACRASTEERFADAVGAYEAALGKVEAVDSIRHADEAAHLFALAMANHPGLEARARALLARDPAFVSAREALAWALGDDADAYAATGLLHRFEEPLTLEAWRARPVRHALSPLPVRAEDRATWLLEKGAVHAALDVLAIIDLPAEAPVRWLVAGSVLRHGTLASPETAHEAAERAWTWIAPLAQAGDHKDVTVAVQAVEIAAACNSPERVLSVPLPEDMIHYPAITGQAYAAIAPLLADALEAVGRSDEAVALRELPTKADVTADGRARRLADEAWALEQQGQVDAAIQRYLEAAEANPRIAGLMLGNAGNLCTRRNELARAERFLDAALALVSAYPARSRACVLDQVAAHRRVLARPADALPCSVLAWELEPTAERAVRAAEDYGSLGDNLRAARWWRRVREQEPRLVP